MSASVSKRGKVLAAELGAHDQGVQILISGDGVFLSLEHVKGLVRPVLVRGRQEVGICLAIRAAEHACHEVNRAVFHHLEPSLERELDELDVQVHSFGQQAEEGDVDAAGRAIFGKDFPRRQGIEGNSEHRPRRRCGQRGARGGKATGRGCIRETPWRYYMQNRSLGQRGGDRPLFLRCCHPPVIPAFLSFTGTNWSKHVRCHQKKPVGADFFRAHS